MTEEKTTRKEIATQAKTTKGDIQSFDRTAWNYMNKQLKLTEPELLKLKGARCPAKVNHEVATLVRFFDPASAKDKGLTINDFESLNEHPELIQYEGYYVRGKGGEIIIKKFDGFGTSILEEKQKKGDITDLGIVIEKTAAQKWLGRIGTFMMMGGFMLVLVAIIGIIVGISLAMKSC